jgi:hypothetical protein
LCSREKRREEAYRIEEDVNLSRRGEGNSAVKERRGNLSQDGVGEAEARSVE